MRVIQVLSTVAGVRAAVTQSVQTHSREQPVVGIVLTMGALHSGHSALLEAARRNSDIVVASLFVNPLQFDDPSDYQHYPRPLDQDLDLLTQHGVDLVFAPTLDEMYPGYPDAPLVRVETGELGRRWEGASRPGHFNGVATVVTKLFTILPPAAPAVCEAWFGKKDAEQLAIIRRLVNDLNLPVQIRALPIVRDENGLALSSRNQRLGAEDYDAALQLFGALSTLAARAVSGEPLGVPELRAELGALEGLELDYFVVVDPSTLCETDADRLQDPALGLVAAKVGPVRLIDNMELHPG